LIVGSKAGKAMYCEDLTNAQRGGPKEDDD